MPRRPTFHTPELADLNRQLAFAPRATQIKRLEAAEALVRDVVDTQAYPVEFIVFKLTGYRPDEAADSTIPGEALRADLVTMIQVASQHCPLPADGSRGEPLDIEAVAERLGRSRRSIRRLRDKGLVFWWTRPAQGAMRLGCPEDMLQWFMDRVDMPARARATAEQRTAIEAFAANHATDSLLALATQAASHVGVSVDTARGVLRRAVESGRVDVAAGTRLQSRQGTLALRAVRRGVQPSVIATRLHVTPPSVHRAVRRAQVRRVHRLLASPPLHANAGETGPPPALRWDTTLVPGTSTTFESARVHAAAAAVAALGATFAACPGRASAAAWSGVEAAVQAVTRHWWGVLLSLSPTIEGAIQQWAGRGLAEVPLPVLRRVLPMSVDATIDTLARSPVAEADRLEGRVRTAVDRALVRVGRRQGTVTDARREGVFLLRHTPWRLLLPDPRWERALDRLSPADTQLAGVRLGLGGMPMEPLDAWLQRTGVTPQAAAARLAAVRGRLHEAAYV